MTRRYPHSVTPGDDGTLFVVKLGKDTKAILNLEHTT